MYEAYLKPLHAGWKFCISEVWKMINTKVDPKDLYFRHVAKVNNIYQFNSYLVETSYNNLEIIEEKFKEHR